MVLIAISAFCALISAAMLWLPLSTPMLAVLLFLLGGGVFALYPVAVSHAADRAPAGALVRMSQGLLLINSIGATISPLMISPVMTVMGDAGLFWAFGALSLFFVMFFSWRRRVRPAPVPVAPFTATTPMSSAGAELVVTEELMQGALEHEHLEDLSDLVPDVGVAEPIVGPPPEDENHIVYYDDTEQAGERH
jgi:MFS family permease